jgi:hypothetical protein
MERATALASLTAHPFEIRTAGASITSDAPFIL